MNLGIILIFGLIKTQFQIRDFNRVKNFRVIVRSLAPFRYGSLLVSAPSSQHQFENPVSSGRSTASEMPMFI